MHLPPLPSRHRGGRREMNLPQFSRPVDDVGAFRFSVHVHSAAVHGFSDPSLLRRERPRAEAVSPLQHRRRRRILAWGSSG